jgi:LytS/YehU family sensor histidine kinase
MEKSEKAPEVVLKLSDMMRYTIYEGKKEVVPLRKEISYLENYIELHQLRYQKTVDITFGHSIDADYGIAPLLFIILLENAFKHGVESLTEHAFVHIRLEAANNKVVFEVENNFGQKKIERGEGIGLENLKRRLKLIYPNRYTLDMAQMENVFRTVLQIELK